MTFNFISYQNYNDYSMIFVSKCQLKYGNIQRQMHITSTHTKVYCWKCSRLEEYFLPCQQCHWNHSMFHISTTIYWYDTSLIKLYVKSFFMLSSDHSQPLFFTFLKRLCVSLLQLWISVLIYWLVSQNSCQTCNTTCSIKSHIWLCYFW